MIKGIYTVSRSMEYKVKNIDVVANNLANINTSGYKREVPFSEYMNDFGESQIRKISDQQQGEIIQTSNPLDLAISGEGFFVVKNENGNAELTRDGRFRLSDEGFLTDSAGKKVMGQNGSINLDDTLFQNESVILISSLGEIKINDKIIDQILVVKVDYPEELERSSGSNFILTEENYYRAEEKEFNISQGYIEESNTNPMLEMEAMIRLNKAYETSQKVISALDQSMDHANQMGKI